MPKFGLPPLVGSIDNKKVSWQRLESIDYDSLGLLLCCHLIIEHYLDNYLASYTHVPLGWQKAKLTFGQKVSLLSKIQFKEPYNLYPSLKHLNSLRNKFSHNLNRCITEEDIMPFEHLIQKCVSDSSNIPKEPNKILHLYTNLVCAYFAGYITYFAEHRPSQPS